MWVRYVLIGLGLVHVVLGVFGLYAPESVAGFLSLDPLNAAALGEVRAVFGGLMLGIGIVFVRGSTGGRGARQWLMAAAVGYAGLALGRILSLAADGVRFHTLVSLLVEAAVCAFVLYAIGVMSGAERADKETPRPDQRSGGSPAREAEPENRVGAEE